MARLESALGRFRVRDGIFVALERMAREGGMPVEVRRYALRRGIEAPDRPLARSDLLYADHALGRADDLAREVADYRADFGADPEALAVLAQFAADAGDPGTADRARATARAAGLPLAELDARVVQACIVARDYPRAIRELEALRAGASPTTPAPAKPSWPAC